jgi:hypothetical protein
MDLGRVNVLLRILAKTVVFWTANTTAALMGIAVWSFQSLGACARMGTLVRVVVNPFCFNSL